MTTIVLATNNANKLREFRALLDSPTLQFISPIEAHIPETFDVEETGVTFQENALLKAKAFAAVAKLPAVADDSGLVVTSLNGMPGVQSKRWVGGSDHDRNAHLLELLKDVEDRRAKFVSVLAIYWPDTDETEFFEGEVTGQIALKEEGKEGFGYDPIFIPDGYNQPFAQLGQDVKNTLSHRFRAIEKLKTYLAQRQEGQDANDLSTTAKSTGELR